MESGSSRGLGRGSPGYRSLGRRETIGREAAIPVPGLALAPRQPSVILTGDLGQLSARSPQTRTTPPQPSAPRQGSVGFPQRRHNTRPGTLPHANPCVLQRILQTPSPRPPDAQRPPPCTYPVRSTGERSRFAAASPSRGASPRAEARLGGLGRVCGELERVGRPREECVHRG